MKVLGRSVYRVRAKRVSEHVLGGDGNRTENFLGALSGKRRGLRLNDASRVAETCGLIGGREEA